jgi:hypothetical protein
MNNKTNNSITSNLFSIKNNNSYFILQIFLYFSLILRKFCLFGSWNTFGFLVSFFHYFQKFIDLNSCRVNR